MLTTVYRIDSDDSIVFVDEAWEEFARANGWDPPTDSVVGQPVLGFVGGTDVRQLYRSIFRKVRETGAPLCFPFRCDSPSIRREMTMSVSPLPGGELEVRATLDREEQRSPIDLLDPASRTAPEWLVLCAWCLALRAQDGEWIELEQAVRELDILSAPLPGLSHGVCPACEASLHAEIDRIR